MRRFYAIVSRRATIVAVGAAVVAVAAEVVRNTVAGAAAVSSSIIIILLLVALLLVLTQLEALRASVEQLSRKAGFSIVYYPASNKDQIGELHVAARRVIERAPPHAEIYAVNSYVEVFRESNDPEAVESQREYLKAYERRFDNLNKYHRLIQVKNGWDGEGRASLGKRLAPAYLEHYQAMARHIASARRNTIKLEQVAARLPTSFVVVRNGDGGEIIWQMNHHYPDLGDDAERMEGIFIINDPDGLLVHNFIDWFNALDKGQRDAITAEHLQ